MIVCPKCATLMEAVQASMGQPLFHVGLGISLHGSDFYSGPVLRVFRTITVFYDRCPECGFYDIEDQKTRQYLEEIYDLDVFD